MSATYIQEEKAYLIDEIVYLNSLRGVTGVEDTYAFDEDEVAGDIKIRLQMKVPVHMFLAPIINVEIPKEFMETPAVKTTVTEVKVPIEFRDKKANVVLTEEVGESGGVLHLIKKLILGKQVKPEDMR